MNKDIKEILEVILYELRDVKDEIKDLRLGMDGMEERLSDKIDGIQEEFTATIQEIAKNDVKVIVKNKDDNHLN